MLKLKFVVDEDYAIAHALSWIHNRRRLPFPAWKEFRREFWEKYPKIYYLITGFIEYNIVFCSLRKISLETQTKQMKAVLREIKKDKRVKRLIEETKLYCEKVRKDWERNKRKALKWLSELSGISLPSTTITVLITHPKLRNGVYIGEKIICWGGPEEYPNFNTAGLCHEILHYLTYSRKRSKIMHSIIELLAEEEIRIRLNKKGRYFQYPGRKDLKKIKRFVFPYWKRYLSERKEKNIFELEKKIQENALKKFRPSELIHFV